MSLNHALRTQRLDGFQKEIQFEVLRRLYQRPELSQRALAKELNISLGSINYCFKALAKKGWIKMKNFGHSQNKLQYAYLLTPSGVVEKTRMTADFLKQKLANYEILREEIKQLEAEVRNERSR